MNFTLKDLDENLKKVSLNEKLLVIHTCHGIECNDCELFTKYPNGRCSEYTENRRKELFKEKLEKLLG